MGQARVARPEELPRPCRRPRRRLHAGRDEGHRQRHQDQPALPHRGQDRARLRGSARHAVPLPGRRSLRLHGQGELRADDARLRIPRGAVGVPPAEHRRADHLLQGPADRRRPAALRGARGPGHRPRHEELPRHQLLQAGDDGNRHHGAGAALHQQGREDQGRHRRRQVHGARLARAVRAPIADLQYFATCVAIWSTTWIAITFQLGTVAPELSVAYRFLLASLLLFAWCLARRLPLRYSAREHAWLALFGITAFGISYVLVYYAEQYVVSGLVAVGYSASPLLGMLGMRLFFGTPMTRRVALASILGIAGIVVVFYPEIVQLRAGTATAKGALFTMLSVLIAALGSIVAYRNQHAGVPLWQGMAWGMLYGGLSALAIALAGGKPVALLGTAQDTRPLPQL